MFSVIAISVGRRSILAVGRIASRCARRAAVAARSACLAGSVKEGRSTRIQAWKPTPCGVSTGFVWSPPSRRPSACGSLRGPVAGCGIELCNSGWSTIGRRARHYRPKSSRPVSPHSRITHRPRGCGRSIPNSCNRCWLTCSGPLSISLSAAPAIPASRAASVIRHGSVSPSACTWWMGACRYPRSGGYACGCHGQWKARPRAQRSRGGRVETLVERR
jgi:hypothetical protein